MIKLTGKAAALQKKAETNLSSILDNINDYYTRDIKTVRPKIEKQTQTMIGAYSRFFKALKAGLRNPGNFEAVGDISDNLLQIIEQADSREGKKVLVPTENIVRAFNTVVYQKIRKGKTQSHEDFTVIGAQLFIVYTNLVQVANSGAFQPVTVPTSAGKKQLTLSDVIALAEHIRQLSVLADAVAQITPRNNEDPLDFQRRALRTYFSKGKGYHLATKDTKIDILSGKAEQRIVIRLDESVKARDEAEYDVGISRNKAFDNPRNFKNVVLNEFKDNFANIEGSKTVENELRKQIADKWAGIGSKKKPKKYNKKSSYRKKATTPKDGKQLVKKLDKLTLEAQSVRLKPLVPTRQRKEKGGIDEVETLKAKINARLAGEVKENMGRPALINRTGRFASSVQLVDLREGPNTLIGIYDYLENPYRTFENQGERKWPVGYNPKPLITKSIRNLAQEFTNKRFTLRRA